jgi:hypothetical protein
LFNFQAFQKPPYLLLGKKSRFGLIPWPAKYAVVQAFVQEKKTVSLPKKTFDAVPSAAAEQIQTFVKGIQR